MVSELESPPVDFLTDAPFSQGALDVEWRHGRSSRHDEPEPPLQIHYYDEHTIVLRQSKTVSFEAPFLFLMFGNDRALLLDTGATADAGQCPLRSTVEGLVGDWLAAHPRDSYGLVVAHTHGHGDHVAGDVQFRGRRETTVVGADRESVAAFFGFSRWPDEIVTFDLGGRILEVTGSPGHHEAAISIYDRWTGVLLTGDTVYPGRLYVEDMPAFTGSLDRLVRMADSHDVRHVVGCHIEMTRTARRDYPVGTTYQPHEQRLRMTVDQLRDVRDAAASVAVSPGAHTFEDFIIFNGPCRAALARQVLRGGWGNLRTRLRP